MARLRFGLLIPTLNRTRLLGRFLDSVAKQTLKPDGIIIVDQSDDSSTRELFEAWEVPGIEKIYCHRKIKSLILSRNVAFEKFPDAWDLGAFLDDDLVLQPNFCENLVRVFEADIPKRYGGGMGTIIGSQKKYSFPQNLFLMPHDSDGRFQASGAPTYPHWKTSFAETEFLSGGITFWRKEVIREYRFDEKLKGYGCGDDVDFSFRVSRKYKLFIEPAARCFHEDHSPGRESAFRFRRAWVQNFYYLAKKNGFSIPGYYWAVWGHLLRDLTCLDPYRLGGTLSGLKNVFKGELDTVEGFRDFLAEQRQKDLSER